MAGAHFKTCVKRSRDYSIFRIILAFLTFSLGVNAVSADSLPNFSSKLEGLRFGQSSTANILIIGDSVSAYVLTSSYVRLNQAYGYGGVMGGPLQVGLYTKLSAGVVYVQSDHSQWITGDRYDIPTGESVLFNPSSSPLDLQSSPIAMSRLKVSYLSKPGAGTFKIQTALMNNGYAGSFSDVVGYENISADGALDLKTLTIPVSPGSVLAWRVVTTQGIVSVINGGWEGERGLVSNLMLARGGKQLVDYVRTPENIWSSFLNEYKPDLVIISVKDDITPAFRTALETIQRRIHAANPEADTLFVGDYNAIGNDPGEPFHAALLEGKAMMQAVVADPSIPGSKIYWDSGAVLGTFAFAKSAGLFQDNVHLNEAGAKVLGDAWLETFDLLPKPLTPLQSWRYEYFGTSANSGMGADDQDYDGDGLSNLVEYALDTLPNSNFSGENPVSEIVGNRLQITFRRARPDVTYLVETSDSLSGWTEIARNPGTVGASVTVIDPVNLTDSVHQRRFLRLRVITP